MVGRQSVRGPVSVHPLAGKTGRTLLVMLAALAIPYASPTMRRLRFAEAPWDLEGPGDPPEEMGDLRAATAPQPRGAGEQALPASENTPTVNNALPPELSTKMPEMARDVRATLRTMPVEDPSGHALDTFFKRLARTEAGEPGAVTRILHYGDSTISSDYVSGTVRRRLQARFGDAGHGFILIANPWQWYFHNDVLHGSNGEWSASRLAGPAAPDGMYGVGGVSFTSYGGGVAWFGTSSHGDFGRRVSRFDLYYLEQPGGGDVELRARGAAPVTFSTNGEAKVSRIRSVSVPDGDSKLVVRALGHGPVRLFGVALERDAPGVVYDALGSHAAMAIYWQWQKRSHWKDQLTLRDPALVILQYGTNESDMWKLDRSEYEAALGRIVDEVHEAAGPASILIVAPLDRAERRNGKLQTKKVMFDLVSIQRHVAATHGAAFWNTFEAMGGEGAMARWTKTRPQLGGEDLTHPTPLGAEVVGDMLSAAIVQAFDAWRAPR